MYIRATCGGRVAVVAACCRVHGARPVDRDREPLGSRFSPSRRSAINTPRGARPRRALSLQLNTSLNQRGRGIIYNSTPHMTHTTLVTSHDRADTPRPNDQSCDGAACTNLRHCAESTSVSLSIAEPHRKTEKPTRRDDAAAHASGLYTIRLHVAAAAVRRLEVASRGTKLVHCIAQHQTHATRRLGAEPPYASAE